jgi:K+-transporting ATPase c subunit
MLVLAITEAARTTIVFILLWGVVFPALVTGLIALAIYQTFTEHRANAENRRYPRS